MKQRNDFMSFWKFLRLLVWLLFFSALSSASQPITRSDLKYSNVDGLGNSCPALDSCGHKRISGRRNLDGLHERNCACDYLCEEFDDCCIDAPEFPRLEPENSASHWKCHEFRQFGGVYVKDTCDSNFSNKELIELCENRYTDDKSDPLRDMPVTDSVTGLTYRNYYCGMCNGFGDTLVIWTPRLECPSLTVYNTSRKNLTEQYVFQNLIFDGQNWGLYLDGDNGSLFFHDCEIDPVMPRLLEGKIRLCKVQSVSDCANDWNDEYIKSLCLSYTGWRYLHSESYRNVHCAVCNRVNVSLLTCQPVEYRDLWFRAFERRAFSLLLDINEQRGQEVGLIQKCENGEIFDPFFKRCRRFSCLPGYVRIGAKCVLQSPVETTTEPVSNSTFMDFIEIVTDVYVEGKQNNTNRYVNHSSHKSRNSSEITNITGVTYNTSMLDENVHLENEIGKFKNCLLISLMEGDFTMFDNKTIYVPEYDKFYEPTNYFAVDGSILVCSHFEQEQDVKFSAAMGYVTVIGLSISMLCLFMHFIVFCIVPDLRNLSGKNLMSQCVALFCAYCFYIVGECKLNSETCIAVAFLTVYFFQASFLWMSSMAFDVWRTLKMATTELRVTTGNKWKRFIAYSIYSWFVPLLILGLAAVAEYTDAFPEEYRPGFGQPRCWFRRRRALLCFFAAPLFVVILSNIILFTSSARMIIMTTKTTAKQSPSQKRNFKLYLRLFILMGLTWVVGLVAGYVDMEVLWYLFIVLNTLQGLFIFVAFSCSTKVLHYLRDRMSKLTKPKDYRSSAVHSTSHSACNTNSTTALTTIISKASTKSWIMKKHAASPTNSSASNVSRH